MEDRKESYPEETLTSRLIREKQDAIYFYSMMVEAGVVGTSPEFESPKGQKWDLQHFVEFQSSKSVTDMVQEVSEFASSLMPIQAVNSKAYNSNGKLVVGIM